MKGLFILFTAILSGIFAGMGMGGGTFLIPALSLIFGYSQAICQSTNVICFIVLGFLCFFIYQRNKLVDYKIVIFVSIPACFISVIFTIFSIKINSSLLKLLFSIFITCFGLFYLITAIIKIIKERTKKDKNFKHKN